MVTTSSLPDMFSFLVFLFSLQNPSTCRFSEFQNFPSRRTGLLILFFCIINLLVSVVTGFLHQVIIVLSPQSSLSWCLTAPFSWVQSPVDHYWEPEFNIVQNATLSPTASFLPFFFFLKSIPLLRSWAFFYTSRCFPACSPLQREVYVCSVLGLGTGSVGVFRCMFNFSSLRRRGQGRIYNSCSWISPDRSFRVLGEGEGNHGRGGHMTRVSPLCLSLLSTWQRSPFSNGQDSCCDEPAVTMPSHFLSHCLK